MYFKLLVFISIIATLGAPRVFAASSDSNSISTKLRLFDFGPTASMVRDSTGMNSLNAGARVGARALNIQEDGVVASLVDASFVTQYVNTNRHPENILGSRQSTVGIDARARADYYITSGASSGGCGFVYFQPAGVDLQTQVSARTAPNDRIRASYLASVGGGCAQKKALFVIGPILKAVGGTSPTYGNTGGSALGFRLAMESKKSYFRIETTNTLTGEEDEGKKSFVGVDAGFRAARHVRLGAAVNWAAVTQRKSSKSLADRIAGQDLNILEINSYVSGAW